MRRCVVGRVRRVVVRVLGDELRDVRRVSGDLVVLEIDRGLDRELRVARLAGPRQVVRVDLGAVLDRGLQVLGLQAIRIGMLAAAGDRVLIRVLDEALTRVVGHRRERRHVRSLGVHSHLGQHAALAREHGGTDEDVDAPIVAVRREIVLREVGMPVLRLGFQVSLGHLHHQARRGVLCPCRVAWRRLFASAVAARLLRDDRADPVAGMSYFADAASIAGPSTTSSEAITSLSVGRCAGALGGVGLRIRRSRSGSGRRLLALRRTPLHGCSSGTAARHRIEEVLGRFAGDDASGDLIRVLFERIAAAAIEASPERARCAAGSDVRRFVRGGAGDRAGPCKRDRSLPSVYASAPTAFAPTRARRDRRNAPSHRETSWRPNAALDRARCAATAASGTSARRLACSDAREQRPGHVPRRAVAAPGFALALDRRAGRIRGGCRCRRAALLALLIGGLAEDRGHELLLRLRRVRRLDILLGQLEARDDALWSLLPEARLPGSVDSAW